MALRLVAKDNMPFVICKNQNDDLHPCVENTVGFTHENNNVKKASSILEKMLISIVPIAIDDKHYHDDDSKLAYSYVENKPFTFKEKGSQITEYKRVWQAGRYIGEAVIDGVKVSIIPRFGKEFLFAMLGELYHFHLLNSESRGEINKKEWNELMRLIMNHLWIRKFSLANKYGVPCRTELHSQQGLQVRGHINIKKSLRLYAIKKQIVSDFREKENDRLICSIVYRAYKILSRKSIERSVIPPDVQDVINTLITCCKNQDFVISESDYKSIDYKRVYLSWKPLVDLSWKIIQGKSIGVNAPNNTSGMCLFLDMAEIWEAYLRKSMGEILAEDGWNVVSQIECEKDVYESMFYKRKIIPDLLFERQKGMTTQYMVFDAKYKRMEGSNEDVDRCDFFQIHSYIQYFSQLPNSEVLVGGLLYPIEQEKLIEYSYSDSLYATGSGNTAFIVDGLYLSRNRSSYTEQSLKQQVENLVERIKQKTSLKY